MNLTNFSSSNSKVEYVVFVCFLAPEYPRYLTWLVCCKVLKSVKDFNRFFYSLTWQYFFKELCFIVGEGIFFCFLKGFKMSAMIHLKHVKHDHETKIILPSYHLTPTNNLSINLNLKFYVFKIGVYYFLPEMPRHHV